MTTRFNINSCMNLCVRGLKLEDLLSWLTVPRGCLTVRTATSSAPFLECGRARPGQLRVQSHRRFTLLFNYFEEYVFNCRPKTYRQYKKKFGLPKGRHSSLETEREQHSKRCPRLAPRLQLRFHLGGLLTVRAPDRRRIQNQHGVMPDRTPRIRDARTESSSLEWIRVLSFPHLPARTYPNMRWLQKRRYCWLSAETAEELKHFPLGQITESLIS
ncbi:unnamed protein product [Nesidiocoris tenuis]|uniref:Uncharacterized protein n=1 Tax=Nesidiocoris tenuis TaxID=355587 RepID=A0A6H5HN68_9HEMI|nr:unnamed protein product [Nesidiocoris tenuis]